MSINFKSLHSNRTKSISAMKLIFSKSGKYLIIKKCLKQFYKAMLSSRDMIKNVSDQYTLIPTQPGYIYLKTSQSFFCKSVNRKSLKRRILDHPWLWWPKLSEIMNWNSHCDSWAIVNSGKSINLKARFDAFLLFKMIFYNI